MNIITGDCQIEMNKMEENSIDLIATDPPYGLSFMGKNWDKAVPSKEICKECLRILKPGAFAFIMCSPRQDCLSRMIVNLGEAGFQTDFTSLYWTYACLSEDTEVFTENGWISGKELMHKSNPVKLLVYDTKKEIYQFEPPSSWNTYKIQENMFRIKSKETDQLVSRNHRVYTSKGFVFAENLGEQTEVVYLSSLPSNLWNIFSRNKKKTKSCWNILLNKLQTKSSNMDVCNKQRETSASYVGRTERKVKTKMDGREKSCLEGRSNLQSEKRKLPKLFNQICKMPHRIYFNVKKRWLCYGTSAISSKTNKQTIETNRSSSSYQPQSRRQQNRKPNAFQNKSRPQKIRKQSKYKTTLATITKEWYEGTIFCPKVSTGCFIARRNNKIFLTGNSGFPKAYNIGKAIDKKFGVEAKQLNGSYAGLNLKPAVEVIIVVMKPMTEKTYLNQALKNGKGITWINDCRIPYQSIKDMEGAKERASNYTQEYRDNATTPNASKPFTEYTPDNNGRFPANLLVEDDVLDKTEYDLLKNKHSKENHGISFTLATPDKKGTCVPPDPNGRFPANLLVEDDVLDKPSAGRRTSHFFEQEYTSGGIDPKWEANNTGRFPANLLVEDDVLNDGRVITSGGTGGRPNHGRGDGYGFNPLKENAPKNMPVDKGSYSKFFSLDAWANQLPFLIVPKATRKEKEKGLEELPDKIINNTGRKSVPQCPRPINRKNIHNTVKPIKLMSYLITLGSREGDIVLDPFAGSGTTGLAAEQLNRRFIGIELNKEYAEIAKKRTNI